MYKKIIIDGICQTSRMLNLSRSHSWQGFGSKEIKRQVRQQAFWQSQRYEQVSGSDLGLPPPPPAPPPSHSAPNSPATARAPRPSSRSPGRSSRSGGRYRPLSKSPSPMRLSGGGGGGDVEGGRPVRNRSSSRKRREEQKGCFRPNVSFFVQYRYVKKVEE